MTSGERTKQWAVIHFVCYLRKTPLKTLDMMYLSSKKSLVCSSRIYKWHRRYNDDLDSVEDDALSGRLLTLTTSADILDMKFAVDSDHRRNFAEL